MRPLFMFFCAAALTACGGSSNHTNKSSSSSSLSSAVASSTSSANTTSSSATSSSSVASAAQVAAITNPNATAATKNLYAFLGDHYGKRIISGQYGDEDIQWVKELTGKTPAIHGFDFMDYMPLRREKGANPQDTESAIDWVINKHGVVEFSWHWDAPADIYDEAYREDCKNVTGGDARWYKAFYSCASHFDLTAALDNPESDNYKAIVRDIDLIAVELKKLQDAGAPVLFRPLHEAAGEWFWWGKQGPEACKRLWKLLHDRLVQLHGINNLIWIWNDYGSEHGNAMDWYPGDAWVDIIAYDYPRAQSWPEYQTNHGDSHKIFGLAEVSGLPNPDNFNDASWSFFIGWNGLVETGNLKSFVKWVYNSNKVISLENLPSLIDYTPRNPSVAAADPAYQPDPDIDYGPKDNPTDNLAYGKPVTVSSTEADYGHIADYLTDGRSVTRWSSTYSDPQWVVVDLGSSQTIDRVEILWESARATDYTLEVSEDMAAWTTIKSVVDGKGSTDDWGHLASKGRYLRLSASKRATNYGVSIFEIRAYATTPQVKPNLALGKPVTVSSTEADFGNTADKATDGDTSTRWSSEYADPQWISVDLQSITSITGVKILWESAYAKAYKIEVSSDGVSWKEIYSTSASDGGTDLLDNLNESARYVRINCLTRATKWGDSIYEISVY